VGEAQVRFLPADDRTNLTVVIGDTALSRSIHTDASPVELLVKIFSAESRQDDNGSVQVIGNYQLSPEGHIIFTPLVRFSYDLRYLAVFGDTLEHTFEYHANNEHSQTRLLNIYPTADTVPENLLKIYLNFSQPMREGEVYQRVKVFDHSGLELTEPFVRLQPELWDSTRQRVTLWFDPGRVKRALGSRESKGAILMKDTIYLLTVDSLWKDSQGLALGDAYRKTMVVTKADRERIDPGSWQFLFPEAHSREPLIITFNEPMDYYTTLNSITVWKNPDSRISGIPTLEQKERVWKLYPKKPWLPGAYTIIIKSKIEDLAGNSLSRPFDREISKSSSKKPGTSEFYEFPFEIASRDESVKFDN